MEYTLTGHARSALAKRKIAMEWLEIAIADPMLVQPDLVDPESRASRDRKQLGKTDKSRDPVL